MNWYKKANDLENNVVDDYNPFSWSIKEEYEIQTIYLQRLRERLEKLQRVALKLNVPPLELTVSEVYVKNVKKGEMEFPAEFVRVKISGNPPQLSDWQFVARIDHTDNGNIINTMRGFEGQIPPSFRESGPVCEHCNINRRRNNTYLVRNVKTNEFKQVGGECMKDFIGHADPQKYASMLDSLSLALREIESDSKDSESMGSREPQIYPTEDALATASAVIRKFGYQPSSTSLPTGQVVFYILYPMNREIQEYVNELFKSGFSVDDDDYKVANEVIEWGKSLNDPSNNYLQNLKVILAGPYVSMKHLNYLSSAIVAKKKIEGSLPPKKDNAERKESNFIGTIGQKVLLKVIMGSKRIVESQYGDSTMFFLSDDNGNKYTIFSTAHEINNIEEGTSFILLATVKDHYSNPKGFKSTTLARGKVIGEDEKDINKAKKTADLILI